MSKQGKVNPVFQLAIRVGKMGPSWPSGFLALVTQGKKKFFWRFQRFKQQSHFDSDQIWQCNVIVVQIIYHKEYCMFRVVLLFVSVVMVFFRSSLLVVLPCKKILNVQQFFWGTNNLMENMQQKQCPQVPKDWLTFTFAKAELHFQNACTFIPF